MGNIYIRTFTGIEFYLDDPKPEMVKIEDVAHALSNLCRFTGHTAPFYSVAQHSVWVADCLILWDAPRHVVRAGLLHDAAEAYYGDLSSPLKRAFGSCYRTVSESIDIAVRQALSVTDIEPVYRQMIKAADSYGLLADGMAYVNGFGLTEEEQQGLGLDPGVQVPPIQPAWPPAEAKANFLTRYSLYADK